MSLAVGNKKLRGVWGEGLRLLGIGSLADDGKRSDEVRVALGVVIRRGAKNNISS